MKVEAGTEEHKEIFCRQFLDTHKPFTPEELEWPDLSEETIEKLKKFKNTNKKIICVGTTSLRVIETLAQNKFKIKSGWTKIFIHTPYKFKITDGLLTNFHLPKSSLVILVSAFCGRKFLLDSYKKAIEWYNSDELKPVKKMRLDNSTSNAIIIKGE